MNQIIAILLPSIIALKINRKLTKKEESLLRQIERYLTYVMFINLIAFIIVIYIFKQTNIVFTYVFTVKYIILSLIISIVLPIIERIIKENIDIGVIVKKDEEKD